MVAPGYHHTLHSGTSAFLRLNKAGHRILHMGCLLHMLTATYPVPELEPAYSAVRGHDGCGVETSARVCRDEGSSESAVWKEHCDKGRLDEAFQAVESMYQRRSGVSVQMLFHLLKKSIEKKDWDVGRRIHAFSVMTGYDCNSFVANHIIRMYASHGNLLEASKVFKKIPVPDTFMWDSIILAHGEYGQAEEVVHLYKKMRRADAKPTEHVLVAVLKACASTGDLASGKMVHADVLNSSLYSHLSIANTLVDMYAKCGNVAEARRVFDRLASKNVVTWSAMISAYAQHGQGQEALSLYERMQNDGMTAANNVTFVSILKACARIGALQKGKQIHAHVLEQGLEEAYVSMGNTLVDMYAKCRSLEDARSVFDRLSTKDVVTWNTMIAGYAQHGCGHEALMIYSFMQLAGIRPDQITFVSILKACSSVGAVQEGERICVHIQELGLDADPFVASSMVDMYAKCGSFGDARTVFDNLVIKDVVAWNAMIAGYSQAGFFQQALDLFMRMHKEGIAPDLVTYVSILKLLASSGARQQGRRIHVQILERGLEADILIGNTLVYMYAEFGSLVEAQCVFDRLPDRDVATWTALINGYGQQNECQMAIRCFEEMQQREVEPDAKTFTSLLAACSHVGLVNAARQYFKAMTEIYGITPSVEHYNCIVDVMGRAGYLYDAERFLRSMPIRHDSVGWTSLLTACRKHGNVELGRCCFNQLLKHEPQQAASYMLMSNMYADAGKWEEANMVDHMRKSAGAQKKPAKAIIEVEKSVYEFVVGDKTDDISSKLRSLNQRLEEGNVLHPELVLPVTGDEREDALCGHAEKLALAFGLLNTPRGTPLLITKNLRMCKHCHSGTKMISRVEEREIVIRDAHRVHQFKDGVCSCGDDS